MYKTMFLLLIGLTLYANKPAVGFDIRDFVADPGRRFDVSEASQLLWRERAKDILLSPQVTEGPKTILYSTGVGSLDSWYPIPGFALKEPPKSGRYHEFTYVNGLLTTVHSIDKGKREIVFRIWHDRQDAPDLCVLYSRGNELLYRLASYDNAGLISDVVLMSKDFEATNISIFENGGIYDTCMITAFSKAKNFEVDHRVLYDGKEVWSKFENQNWKRVNFGSKRASLTSLKDFGVKPHYPIPAE